MKLVSRGGNGLASRPLALRTWLVLLAVISAIKLMALMLLRPPSPVVPDEGLYALIVGGLVQGEAIDRLAFDLGYSPDVIVGSWLLVGPAVFPTTLGLDALFSVRLVALVVSVAAVVLALLVAHRARPQGIALASPAGLSLLALLLVPSYQIWGTLALRESSTILSMVFAVWGLSLLTLRPTRVTQGIGLFTVFAGTVGMYTSRSYLALILSAAIAAAVLVPPLRGRRIIVAAILGVIVAGNYAGSEIRASAPPPIESSSAAVESSSADTEALGLPEAPEAPEATESALAVIDSRVSKFYSTREGLRLNAESAYPFNYCEESGVAVSTLACEAVHLPVGIYRFLLTPNVIETGTAVPPQRLAAGFENLIWLVIFIAAGVSVVARRSLSPRLTVFLVTLLVLSTVAYALVSGNEGTAFRHKGQFLWAWCLLIVLGTGWRPWVRSLRRPKQKEVSDMVRS